MTPDFLELITTYKIELRTFNQLKVIHSLLDLNSSKELSEPEKTNRTTLAYSCHLIHSSKLSLSSTLLRYREILTHLDRKSPLTNQTPTLEFQFLDLWFAWFSHLQICYLQQQCLVSDCSVASAAIHNSFKKITLIELKSIFGQIAEGGRI